MVFSKRYFMLITKILSRLLIIMSPISTFANFATAVEWTNEHLRSHPFLLPSQQIEALEKAFRHEKPSDVNLNEVINYVWQLQ